MSIENTTVSFPCPECKLNFPVYLHQLVEGGVVVCPRCRANNAETELRQIEHSLEDIGKSLQNLKKHLQGKVKPEPQT
ncbi:MAG: hypothetical protein ABID87_09020 [Chloroflexota bacterium]